jgi:hypothetical protein
MTKLPTNYGKEAQTTTSIKVTQGSILLIEIYVDDIVLEVLMTG